MNITLPPIQPFQKSTGHENAWADHYGALRVAAAYCGLALPDGVAARGLWQHGVFGPWVHHSPRLLAYNAPGSEDRIAWVAREDQAELLRANGYAFVRAVGMPIVYTPPSGLARQRRSLLVMPGHAIGGWQPTDRSAFERYADEVVELSRSFDHVVVCLSPRDRQSGLWVREFTARKIPLIDGAATTDANALRRMRALFEQFETVTTNAWGSHVAYALAFGARVAICGTYPALDKESLLRVDATWRADPQALARNSSAESIAMKHEILQRLHVMPEAAVEDRALGEWFIGAKHRLAPEAMRELLPTMIALPASAAAATSASTTKPEVEPVDLPVVLIRSHEHNYSETFVEDHVRYVSRNLTLLYGFPFPRFLKGGKSVVSAAFEAKLKTALEAGGALPAELWTDYTRDLAAFLRGCGARVALVETGLMGAFVHEACERAALPFVVHFHGVDAFGRELLDRWIGRYRKFFQTAEKLVVVSRAMHAQLLQLGAPEEKVVLAPYGVAVELAAIADPAKAGPRFVAVGRFVEKKGPHLTLQAFAAVRKLEPTARLVMIGDGPLLKPCQEWVQKSGLGPAVTFAGVQSREEVSRQMAASRVFVQHSMIAANGDSEGLPLAILEAGAHGLAIVSTLHAGIPDAVRDRADGFLVKEKDVHSMAAAMLRLARDPALAGRFGASFRQRVIDEYSRRVSIERLQQLLTAAANAFARPADGAAANGPADVPTRTPAETVACDRNDLPGLAAIAQAAWESGDVAIAYQALGELRRLAPADAAVVEKLRTLDEGGALHDPQVSAYRERAGWRPRAKAATPRRILVVTNLLPPQELGGFGRTVWEFSRELVERGHEVQVLTADVKHLERKPTAEHAAFERHVSRSLLLFGDWKNGASVMEPDPARLREAARRNHHTVLMAAKAFRPDAVMVGNLDFVGHFFVQELLNAGIPVLHRLGNANPGYDPAQTPRSSLYCVASCSEWVNANLRRRSFPIERFAVLPPGSPLTEYFRAFPAQREELRIAFASLLMPYKGAHVLVEALAHLQRAGIPFTCTLAGDSTRPEYVEELKAVAAQNGFLEQLRFPGFLAKQELAALYAKSNVLVFPSVFEEPFGKTQIEAMAAGLVVVTSGSGGASEIVRDGETGLIFKGGDAADLAEKLARLHGEPDFAARLATAGQADAFRFTTGACVDPLESLLEGLIADARRAAAEAPKMTRTVQS